MSEIIVGMVRAGRQSIALTGDLTLSAAQQAVRHIEFTGSGTYTVTLAAAIEGHEWYVYNATGNNLTFKASGGTGITIANARGCLCRCDGSDVRRMTADCANS